MTNGNDQKFLKRLEDMPPAEAMRALYKYATTKTLILLGPEFIAALREMDLSDDERTGIIHVQLQANQAQIIPHIEHLLLAPANAIMESLETEPLTGVKARWEFYNAAQDLCDMFGLHVKNEGRNCEMGTTSYGQVVLTSVDPQTQEECEVPIQDANPVLV